MNKKIIDEYFKINRIEDDDTIYKIKLNFQKLKEPEKIIFINYLEYGTYADIAKIYKVTKPTAKNYVIKIKKKLLKNIK